MARALHDITGEDINVQIEKNDVPLYSTIPITEMIKRNFYSPNVFNTDNFIKKVIYTDDADKLDPKLIRTLNTGGMKIGLDSIGTYKSRAWSFQKEWRYRFIVYTYNPQVHPEQAEQLLEKYVAESILNTVVQPFPWYDMTLNNEAFSKMEVTLSPTISPGNRILVKTLLDRYNPSAELLESSLYKLIR
jgi:hypothetical protein